MQNLPRVTQQQNFRSRAVGARDPNIHKHFVAIGRRDAAVGEQHIPHSVYAQTAASGHGLNRRDQLSNGIERLGNQVRRRANIEVGGILVKRIRGERL